MKQIVRLVTKSELLTQEQAKNLEEQLLLFPSEQLPEYAKRVILNSLYQLKEPDKKIGWGLYGIHESASEYIEKQAGNKPRNRALRSVILKSGLNRRK